MIIERAFEKNWELHKEMSTNAEVFASFAALGEIWNFLLHQPHALPSADQWRDRLRQINVDKTDVDAATRKAREHLNRICHILGIGSAFDFDEILLVLSFRIDVALLGEYLQSRGFSLGLPAELARADDALTWLSDSKGNAREFKNAQTTIVKNSGIPLQTYWLTGET